MTSTPSEPDYSPVETPFRMIPAEAVEAAAKYMQAVDAEEGFGDYPLSEYTTHAAAILEAAAPYMLAAAWAEGAQAGFNVTREGFNGECAFEHCADGDYPPTNPHSGQPWTVKNWTAE